MNREEQLFPGEVSSDPLAKPQTAEPRMGGQAEPKEHILQFFTYEHLPPHLQAVSRPFCVLAQAIVFGQGDEKSGDIGSADPVRLAALPRNLERTVALRKLLESKDAAVRALLATS